MPGSVGWSAAHFGNTVRQFLNEQIDWRKRFPCMAPQITGPNTTGLFLCGYVKNAVYQEKTANL
jgi:hypothetical protein